MRAMRPQVLHILHTFSLVVLTCGFYGEAAQFDITRHLTTMTPYEPQQSYRNYSKPPDPSCSVVHINLLSRHGARNPTAADIKNFNALQQTLSRVGNAVTNSSYAFMKGWINPFPLATQGLLSASGQTAAYEVGQRFAAAFPEIFNQSYLSTLFPVQTTQVPRTSQTGASFMFGAFEGRGALGSCGFQPFSSFSESEGVDTLLRFFTSCQKYASFLTENASLVYQQAELYANASLPTIAQRITRSSGINNSNESFSIVDVVNMFSVCGYQAAVQNELSQFCSIFTPDEVLVLEYTLDLAQYWAKSYAFPLNWQIAVDLLADFVRDMNLALNSSSVYGNTVPAAANLRFAHAETVIPFVTMLGLFDDGQLLMANSSASFIANRLWRSSDVAPFNANIATILYKCADEDYVKLLMNEAETPVPGCGLYCPFSSFQKLYSQALSYNFTALCGATPCPPSPSINGYRFI